MTLVLIYCFVVGVCLGSFLNVVLYRFDTGLGVKGRSMCMSCSKKLGVLELVPVLSYVLLRGKCRGCRTSISIQYPLVELAAGLIVLAASWSALELLPAQPAVFVAWLVLVSLVGLVLLAIFVYDLRHMLIPDMFSYLFIAAALALTALRTWLPPSMMWALPDGEIVRHIVAAVLVAAPLLVIWLATKGRGLGLGDVILAIGMGMLLGMSEGFAALMLSFWIGAAFAICYVLYVHVQGKRGSSVTSLRKKAIPFGPFLIIATVVVFVFSISFMDVVNVFSFWQGVR